MHTPQTKPTFTTYQWYCVALAATCIAAGTLGMLFSFIYLTSSIMAEIYAGMSGFLAGAILISNGVITLALLCTLGHRTSPSINHTGSEDRLREVSPQELDRT